LIKAGANVNIQNIHGNIAFDYARTNDKKEIMVILIKSGSKINFPDNNYRNKFIQWSQDHGYYEDIIANLIN